MVAPEKARAGPIQYDRGPVETSHGDERDGTRSREAAPLAAATAAFLYLVTFRGGDFVYGFHKATTGVWVDEGARVAAGETMYRDFSDVVGPGIVYLNALIIRLFGQRLDAIAWAGIATGVTLALALHALSARVAGRGARLLAPALFVVLVYAHGGDVGGPQWPAMGLVMTGLLPIMRGPASLARAGVAGLAMGTASLFQVEMGVGAALGVAAHLLRDERGKGRAALVFGLACLALPALVMILFSLAAGASHVWSAWLVEPWRQRLPELRIDLGPGWGARQVAGTAIVLGGAAAAVGFLRPGRPAGESGARLLARAGLGVLLAPAVAHMDAHTVTNQATVLLACLVAGLETLSASTRPLPRWVARVAVAVLAIGLVHGVFGLVVWRQMAQNQVRQQFRAGRAWIAAPALELEWIERRTSPGDPLFAFPAAGMYFFLTHTRNATSFPSMVEGRAGVEAQRRALQEIDRVRPAAGVWLGAQRFPVPPGSPPLDVLYEGIRDRYEPEAVLPNGTILFRLKPASGP
jgi:hypothetical protein